MITSPFSKYLMFHYVYRITDKKINRHYYGVRSSHVKPAFDLGIRYFSSSTDEEFIENQKRNPSNFRYKIVVVVSNRERALILESRLHTRFNVDENNSFFNRAKQNFGGLCDAHGYVSIRDEVGNTGRVRIDDARYIRGELTHVQYGRVNAIDVNGRRVTVTTDEYKSGEYTCNNTGKVPVRRKDGTGLLISKEEFHEDDGAEYLHVSAGMISARDTATDSFVSVSPDEFVKSDRYVGVNKGRVSGSMNPNAKTISIRDVDGKEVWRCYGNFKQVCKDNNLPFTALKRSYLDDGRKIYIKNNTHAVAEKKGYSVYTGWSAIIVNTLA